MSLAFIGNIYFSTNPINLVCFSFQNSAKPKNYIQACIEHFSAMTRMILNALKNKKCTLKTREFPSEAGHCLFSCKSVVADFKEHPSKACVPL